MQLFMQNINENFIENQIQESETLNIRAELEKYLVHWKWFLLGVIGGDSPNAERLGGELPEYYATKVEVDAAQSAADTSQVTADEAALLALGVR